MVSESDLGRRFGPLDVSWSWRESALYAMGIGAGRDPLDLVDLRFLLAEDMLVIPSFVTVLEDVLPTPGELGLDPVQVVHGEEQLVLHRPIPPEGHMVLTARLRHAAGRGPGRGVALGLEISGHDIAGKLVLTRSTSWIARGDVLEGEIGQPLLSDRPVAQPDPDPDRVIEIATRPEQALLYRLSGDLNPLHASPAFAMQAGFERPILHGLCTFGIACHAIARAYADGDPRRITAHRARFVSPVYPGETLLMRAWRDDHGVSFDMLVPERGVTVIRRGYTRIS